MTDALRAQEEAKYRAVWTTVPDYRCYSPGLNAAPEAFSACGMRKGESLLDLGCGTGRAGAWFHKQGMNVTLLDLCDKAPECQLPFVVACLWEPSELPPFDWIFCCDVLEHLPPEKVGPALDVIAGLMEKGGYLQVFTAPDAGWGGIGDLHLTVRDASWWAAMIEQRMEIIRRVDAPRPRAAWVVRPKRKGTA